MVEPGWTLKLQRWHLMTSLKHHPGFLSSRPWASSCLCHQCTWLSWCPSYRMLRHFESNSMPCSRNKCHRPGPGCPQIAEHKVQYLRSKKAVKPRRARRKYLEPNHWRGRRGHSILKSFAGNNSNMPGAWDLWSSPLLALPISPQGLRNPLQLKTLVLSHIIKKRYIIFWKVP